MADIASENALLRSLLPGDLDRLRPHLQAVELRSGDVLYEMEDKVGWVYFPGVGLLSVITVMASGAAIETSIVGREGGVGFVEVRRFACRGDTSAKPSTPAPRCAEPCSDRRSCCWPKAGRP